MIVDVYGRRLLYDGGGGPYEVSKFRDFAIDTPSHNTVLVDGIYKIAIMKHTLKKHRSPAKASSTN